ncbi:MAG: hypothetical protein EBT06_06435 [Gammaproteobacteria bacterium]|nr:hypothetical protein [Gammaproteobacteria bacterium]NBT44549.1 hypothetical protein [Gammaproteobacteria bacterium]NBY21593.1 hypothetical protein [Gammaproteobacteria bacterium]NDG88019.1 hypothetical protein [Gammaproteobacteria bacterium]
MPGGGSSNGLGAKDPDLIDPKRESRRFVMIKSKSHQRFPSLLGVGLVLGSLFLGCAPLNQDIQEDLSTDPKTCVNGHRYLPFTNGTDEAFTSEGKEIPCRTPSPPVAP